MDQMQIAASLSRIPPARNPTYLQHVARVRCLRGGIVSGWLRPNVHVDGNPLRLSCPMERHFAETYLAKPFPALYELVECDKAGIPVDRELRHGYLTWLKSQYSLDLFEHYPDEQAPAPHATEQAAAMEAPARPAPVVSTPPEAPTIPPIAPAAAEPEALKETAPPAPAAPAAPAEQTHATAEPQAAPPTEPQETAAAPARPNGRKKGDSK